MLPGNDKVESVSTSCVKVYRAMRYKRVPFEVVLRGKRLKALNPQGTLPVLQVGQDRIADCTAILSYLDKLHPERPLLPEDPLEAAHARLLEDWADTSLTYYLVYLRWYVEPNYDLYKASFKREAPREFRRFFKRRHVRRMLDQHGIGRRDYPHVIGELRRALDDVTTLVDGAGRFLVGDTLSVADLGLFAVLYGMCAGVTPDGEQLITEREGLRDYVERVNALTLGEGRRATLSS